MSYSYDDAVADGWRPGGIRRYLRRSRRMPRTTRRTRGPARAPARRVKRTLKRGYKTKRATFKSAAPRNARALMSSDAAAYLKMLYSPSRSPPVRGPLCMTATAISSSRMRGSITTKITGDNDSVGPEYAQWLRVMPCLGFIESGYNANHVTSNVGGWNSLDKIQHIEQWNPLSGYTPADRIVQSAPDPMLTAGKAYWSQYRPLACSVRIWATSALESRNGTIYFARTHLPQQVDVSGSDPVVLNATSAQYAHNNRHVALNGTIVDLSDGFGTHRTCNFDNRLNGDDITPVSATADLGAIELSWRPLGPSDYEFANVYSTTRFNGAAGGWDHTAKLYQRTALDVLIASTTPQTYEYEVVTVYEYVPNETVNRLVTAEKSRVTLGEAQQAQEHLNDAAHGGQNAPDTIVSDSKENAILQALASNAQRIGVAAVRGAGTGIARHVERYLAGGSS